MRESVAYLIAPQFSDGVDERFHVLKAQINRGEADVGDVVDVFQPRHHPFADFARGDFAVATDAQAVFDVVNQLVDFIDADRAFFNGAQKTVAQFVCRECLPLAVLLDHHRQRDFCRFVGGEAGGALRIGAFASAADFAAVAQEARVNDAGVRAVADGAMQGSAP